MASQSYGLPTEISLASLDCASMILSLRAHNDFPEQKCRALGAPCEDLKKSRSNRRTACVAEQLGYDHVAYAKLGPDHDDAIELLAEQVVPALR
jgi:hypothetical protein